MKRLKKAAALLLSMVLLLSGINIGRTEEQAAGGNKTSAQVILRWHLQAGNIAIPGSSNEDHIN